MNSWLTWGYWYMFLLLKELLPPDGLPARTHPLGRGVFNETPSHIIMMIMEAKKTKLRFVKHANDKIAAKFIVCPGDDSVVGTPGWTVLCLCRKLTRKLVFHFSVKFLIRLSRAIYLEVLDCSIAIPVVVVVIVIVVVVVVYLLTSLS